MKLLTTFTLLTIYLSASGQTIPAKKEEVQQNFTKYSGRWLHTESRFPVAAGKEIVIQNSLPKGGGRYTDASGEEHSYVIFWFRIINETTATVQLSTKFPAEPFAIFPSRDAYIKLFLPPDSMTLDKDELFDYGLTNLQSSLDAGFNQPSMLQRTIKPRGEALFYVAVLFNQARGSARAALVLKGQDLYFKISVSPDVDSAMIPCGQIKF